MIKSVDTIAPAWDMISPSAIRNSWKILLPLLSSSMQNDLLEETAESEFIQQFFKLTIKFTDNDI